MQILKKGIVLFSIAVAIFIFLITLGYAVFMSSLVIRDLIGIWKLSSRDDLYSAGLKSTELKYSTFGIQIVLLLIYLVILFLIFKFILPKTIKSRFKWFWLWLILETTLLIFIFGEFLVFAPGLSG